MICGSIVDHSCKNKGDQDVYAVFFALQKTIARRSTSWDTSRLRKPWSACYVLCASGRLTTKWRAFGLSDVLPPTPFMDLLAASLCSAAEHSNPETHEHFRRRKWRTCELCKAACKSADEPGTQKPLKVIHLLLGHSLPEFMNFKLFGKTILVVIIKFQLFLGHPASDA